METHIRTPLLTARPSRSGPFLGLERGFALEGRTDSDPHITTEKHYAKRGRDIAVIRKHVLPGCLVAKIDQPKK